MFSRTCVPICLVAILAGTVAPADARPARPAPPLPAPAGAIVNVNTEAQLQAAVRSLRSNTTIVIAPGTYVLTSTLYVKGVSQVGIRGATSNADDVVLVGPGMSQPSYGSVPFGIWTGLGADGVTIANLTIRDLYFHPIIFNAGTTSPRVYNVHLIDAGEQFIKVNPDGAGGGVDNGIVEYSVIEFSSRARDDYAKGVDIQTAKNWIIRHNLFRNIVAPPGQLAGPGILAWRGASNTLVEGNLFINCARGIMLGSDDYYSPSQRGGIVRNNIFFRSGAQPGDVGVILSDSPDTQVVNNTLFVSGTYGSPIEYRYAGTTNVLIANNLLDGVIKSRDGATATLLANLERAGPGNFVDANGGDLHLSASAVPAIDQGTPIAAVLDDWDGQVRPQGAGYDIGADERGATAVAYGISGRITDASGTGRAGVTVTLSGGQARTATTGAGGDYRFASLGGGADYTVTPSQAGYTFTPASRFYTGLARDEANADFTATATSSAPGGTAAFLRADASTRGNWQGRYGAEGYALAGASTSLPSYAALSISGASTWIWFPSTADSRAVQKPGSSDRLLACWYSSTTMTIDVNLTDGRTHQLALYSVDWDDLGRSVRFDVLDASSGAVLDTRTASGLQGGRYMVWSVSGHVTLRVANTGPANAVISGILLDPVSAAPEPPSGGAAASFTRTDQTTGGTWSGVYGSQGYAIASDAASGPAWARVSFASALLYTWNWYSAEARATERPGGGSRLAACWYSPGAFTGDVDVLDGASHQAALYLLDWDRAGRVQRVDVLDAATGAVLDSRTVTNFAAGVHLVWTIRGHVTFRLVNLGSPNVVLSAMFFD